MTDIVHLLVLKKDDRIDAIAGAYSNPKRAEQDAKIVRQRSDLRVECEPVPVNHGSRF